MHTPLHLLDSATSTSTAGRIEVDGENVWLANAHTRIRLLGSWDVADGDLVRVHGEFGHEALRPDEVEIVGENDPRGAIRSHPFEERAALSSHVRDFFEARSFLEVETPNLVREPGTDMYIEPIAAGEHFLHTSPEFAMKRLLVDGFERIFQVAKVYRAAEVGPLHNPEFTILEWYRAWESMEAIMQDVEKLVSDYLGLGTAFERITMQNLFLQTLDIDLLSLTTANALRERCRALGVLDPPDDRRWDEIFFELLVTHIDDALAERGAVFVTHWPSSQAVLARKCPSDPRVALRFELYVDGLELANGFEELTDAEEQRARFADDLEARRDQGLPALPMPEVFLSALRRGMPPSSGVALGLDRLLMKKMGADRIDAVAPFAWFGNES